MKPDKGYEKCPNCGGKGSYMIGGYVIGRQRVLCPDCKGRGVIKCQDSAKKKHTKK